MVNEVVKQKLQGDFVHALSIEAKTPAQWSPDYQVEASPNCKGGFGK
jgi:BolA protein